MKIGYCRTSTLEQKAGFEAQLRDLKAYGCEQIFEEHISGTLETREQLLAALKFLRPGDELVVTNLIRLARNLAYLIKIAEMVKTAGAGLIILDMRIDTNTVTGKLMLQIFGALGEWERDIMKLRQAEGIARAKAKGVYKRRKQPLRGPQKKKIDGPQFLRKAEYAKKILDLDENGYRGKKISRDRIALEVGCGRRTVFRVLKEFGRIGPRIPGEAKNAK